MEASVEVIQPGFYTSLQDQGRIGFREYGVPISGAMDSEAAALANLLLDNSPNAAVLEITLQGPKLRFNHKALIVITGALLSPQLEGHALKNYKVYSVSADEQLSFDGRISGYRAYLGIKNGFETAEVLGSLSWCAGITKTIRLEKGMNLNISALRNPIPNQFSTVKPSSYLEATQIEAYPGPEYAFLSSSEKEKLQKMNFTLGKDSNRMGIRFQEKLKNSLEAILTGPVLPGTVQLTPTGILIVLMRDCQTTGGYPRIFQLKEESINILAQKIPGQQIGINLCDY